MKIEFHIEFPGERAAGLMPYSEIVRIEIAHGPTGDHEQQQMVEMFREALVAWYDGAKVVTKEAYDSEIDELARRHAILDEIRHE